MVLGMKGGGKHSCPFCLVNMKTNVHWRPDWPIMREFDNNWELQPNLEGKKYWANILKLIELEEQRLANEKEKFEKEKPKPKTRQGKGKMGNKAKEEQEKEKSGFSKKDASEKKFGIKYPALLPIPLNRIIIDVLHLELRISERFLLAFGRAWIAPYLTPQRKAKAAEFNDYLNSWGCQNWSLMRKGAVSKLNPYIMVMLWVS